MSIHAFKFPNGLSIDLRDVAAWGPIPLVLDLEAVGVGLLLRGLHGPWTIDLKADQLEAESARLDAAKLVSMADRSIEESALWREVFCDVYRSGIVRARTDAGCQALMDDAAVAADQAVALYRKRQPAPAVTE